MTKKSEIPIKLEETVSKRRLYTPVKAGEQAEMTFSKTGETLLIIDHTSVPAPYSGTGIGVRLVEAGIAYARNNYRKIVPLCPYAAHQFRKHAEWHDVLNK